MSNYSDPWISVTTFYPVQVGGGGYTEPRGDGSLNRQLVPLFFAKFPGGVLRG